MAENLLSTGDMVRSSWSEDVRLDGGGRVYVSTAVEITVRDGEAYPEVLRRLRLAQTNTHKRNIETAKGGK